MSTIIEAIYEGGVFRPTREIKLTEGTHVEVVVPAKVAPPDPRMAAARLGQLAARAPVSGQRESTSIDHDQILYGDQDRR